MKLRAATLFALTIVGLGLVVLVSPAMPAWACSCVSHGQDERADLIVVGTVTEVTDTAVRLALESVEKGSAGERTVLELKVGRYEASCGYDFRAGTRYRVNSHDGATGLCAGIRELPDTPSPPAVTPTLVTAEPAPAQLSGRGWIAAGAALAALAAGLVAVALRRRPRTG